MFAVLLHIDYCVQLWWVELPYHPFVYDKELKFHWHLCILHTFGEMSLKCLFNSICTNYVFVYVFTNCFFYFVVLHFTKMLLLYCYACISHWVFGCFWSCLGIRTYAPAYTWLEKANWYWKTPKRINNDCHSRVRSTRNSRNIPVNVKMMKTHVWRFEIQII